MIQIRPSASRGHFDHGWLDTYHTFSFGQYHDPGHVHFRALRVLNEDWVAAGKGFPTHPHRDMEIVTWVLEGALEHRDSTGTRGVIRPGDVQRMTAGTGIEHSEFNASKTEKVHLIQVWLLPDRNGHEPGYEQKAIDLEQRKGKMCLIASLDGADGSVRIHQDARIYSSLLGKGERVRHELGKGRSAYVQVTRGSVSVNAKKCGQGDGAELSGEAGVEVTGESDGSEVLVFDLA